MRNANYNTRDLELWIAEQRRQRKHTLELGKRLESQWAEERRQA